MRTFILRSRKGSTKLCPKPGTKDHVEIIAHALINAFFISQGFREEVTVYLVLDSSEDFPRTICFSGNQGLSLTGFHEEAVLGLIDKALKESIQLKKDQSQTIVPGLEISGFGFERLISLLQKDHNLYLLSPKGENIQNISRDNNPVFILSDHLPLPPKTIKGLKRKGIRQISLGKKMLFASQCVTILHYELDKLFI